MRFRILAGKHIQDGPNGKPVTYGAPNPKGEKPVGGDIIESHIDLVARFNHPDAIKFERVYDPPPQHQQQPSKK